MLRRPPFLSTIVLVLVLACVACSGQQAVLRDSLATLNAARDGFIVWDDVHQGMIVRSATSLEDGKRELAAYRAKREVVVRAFELGYKVIATAALDTTADNIALVLGALADLKQSVEALGATWGAPKAGST